MLMLRDNRQLAKSPTSLGFTIVELLIVIVIIAILATISVVAYNGIQDRARQAALQSASKQVASKIMAYEATESQYPDDLSQIGFKNARDGAKYQYTVSNSTNPKTWCVTISESTDIYRVSNTKSSPETGACAGHYA